MLSLLSSYSFSSTTISRATQSTTNPSFLLLSILPLFLVFINRIGESEKKRKRKGGWDHAAVASNYYWTTYLIYSLPPFRGSEATSTQNGGVCCPMNSLRTTFVCDLIVIRPSWRLSGLHPAPPLLLPDQLQQRQSKGEEKAASNELLAANPTAFSSCSRPNLYETVLKTSGQRKRTEM